VACSVLKQTRRPQAHSNPVYSAQSLRLPRLRQLRVYSVQLDLAARPLRRICSEEATNRTNRLD
jgi:hypothetical protein